MIYRPGVMPGTPLTLDNAMQPPEFVKLYVAPTIGQILVIFDVTVVKQSVPEGRIIVMFSRDSKMHTLVLEGEDPYSANQFFSAMTEDYAVELVNRAVFDYDPLRDGIPVPLNIDGLPTVVEHTRYQ